MYDVHGGHPAFEREQFFEESHSESISCKNIKSETQFEEVILDHWEGYEGSGPVRIGNAASSQNQMDIYGELMDAVYLCDKYCRPISYSFWKFVKQYVIGHVIDNWRDADHGIWELRGPKQHYVYSKVMCWVCLDRGKFATFTNYF